MKHQHEDDENMNCEEGNSTQNTTFCFFFSPRSDGDSTISRLTLGGVHCGSGILTGYDYAKCGIRDEAEEEAAEVKEKSQIQQLSRLFSSFR